MRSKQLRVDREEMKLFDVALMEAGREATGHGIFIDERTIETALSAINESGGIVRSYYTHDHRGGWLGWESFFEDSRSEMAIPGFFSGCRIENNKLIAGEFQFYESFATENPGIVSQLMEMAEKTPTIINQSLEILGYAVFIDEDGNEYQSRPEGVELKYELPVLRIADVYASAFVTAGAATSSLFAFGRNRPKKSEINALIAELAPLVEKFKALNTGSDRGSQQPTNTKTDMTISELFAAVKSGITDLGRQARAFSLIAETEPAKIETLTVESIEAQLSAKDNETAAKRAETLAAENNTLAAQLEAEKAARADLETRFNKFKTSGHDEQLDTGTAKDVAGRYTGLTAQIIAEKQATFGANFAMTSIADLWVPEITIQGLAERVLKQSNLLTTDVVVRSDIFQQIAEGAGTESLIPFFREPDFEDEVQKEGTEPTINALDSGRQKCPILNRVGAIGGTALAAVVSGSDPMGYALLNLAGVRLRQRERTLKSILDGLFGGAFSDIKYPGAVEAEADVTADNLIDAPMINAAEELFGEGLEQLEGGVFWCHPHILTKLKDQDLIETVKPSESNPITLHYYGGMRVFTNKSLVRGGTTSGKVYQTYLLQPRTIATGDKPQVGYAGGQAESVASLTFWDDPKTNDSKIYDRTRFVLQPAGARWKGDPAGQSATNEELATAGNWELAFSEAAKVGIVLLETNG